MTKLLPLLLSLVTMATPGIAMETRSLAGSWQFALGGADAAGDALPAVAFNDIIALPATTETAGKGPPNTGRETQRLTRIRRFEGTAWYRRMVTVPTEWRGKRLALLLERTKPSRLWLDGRSLGGQDWLCVPQIYDLGAVEPGEHTLTIAVDNRRRPPHYGGHQLSDDTQTNWNGILGRIELQATDDGWIRDVQVYPDAAQRSAKVRVSVGNGGNSALPVNLALTAESFNHPGTPDLVSLPARAVSVSAGGGSYEFTVAFAAAAHLWGEFTPAMYRLSVTLSGAARDSHQTEFGLHTFATHGGQFTSNGRPTFLRGKHDACVFPLTGHPPMDTAGWLKYLRILREYGINHVRCHTWIPPEAAFAAADRLGIYLQPELPFWGGYSDEAAAAFRAEALRILDTYGNHPSFVMFSLGNELGGDRAAMQRTVAELRAHDPRHLYASGSNIDFGQPRLQPGDDFWSTFGTIPPGGDGHTRQATRGSYATVDGIGHIQSGPADTLHDFRAALPGVPIPVVGHETGQFTVYPDFREIERYTVVLRARNLEVFRDKLAAAGMADQAHAFFDASGALAVTCYREDCEASLRTPGFGGFQVLDLQDFPGQGTALVGILNALMETKGLVTPERWREWCGPVVPLACFGKYAWTTSERFTANLDVAQYGPSDLPSAVTTWSLSSSGKRLAGGTLPAADQAQGNVRQLGQIEADLHGVPAPAACELTVTVTAGLQHWTNRWPLWVYAAQVAATVPAGVHLARAFDDDARTRLAAGERVVLIPADNGFAKTVPGGFATDFWCWPMFHNRPGTMGLLLDPKQPALSTFPTASHSDWQWFGIASHATPVILDATPHPFRPLVQVIDNLDRCHKLGLVFEARVGAGRLLVCACDLMELAEDPAARQLLASLLAYAGSDHFAPRDSLEPALLADLLTPALSHRRPATATSTQGPDVSPERAFDGDEATRWCAADNKPGYSLTVDLGRPCHLTGVSLLWEQDRRGYGYRLEGSVDGTTWRLLSDQTTNAFAGARHEVPLDAADVRHVRITSTTLPEGAWMSLREMRVTGR